jgi:hypothetical protein
LTQRKACFTITLAFRRNPSHTVPMSVGSICKVSAPWYVHPYFAGLLTAGGIIASSLILKHLEPTGALRVAVALLATPPSAFLVWTFVRWIRGLDELEHRIVFEAVSFAFVTAILAMIAMQGLDRAGVLPEKVGWEVAWEGMAFLYVAGYGWARRRYR